MASTKKKRKTQRIEYRKKKIRKKIGCYKIEKKNINGRDMASTK